MFAKSFKLVFGVGAAIVATFTLAGAAIGLFTGVMYLLETDRQVRVANAAKDSAIEAFKAGCADLRADAKPLITYQGTNPGADRAAKAVRSVSDACYRAFGA